MPSVPNADPEREAWEGLMETLWHGNAPGIDYYGPNDEKWDAAAAKCKAENAAELAAYATEVRASAIRRCLEAVEATREGVKGADPDNVATWAHDEGTQDAISALTSLLSETPK